MPVNRGAGEPRDGEPRRRRIKGFRVTGVAPVVYRIYETDMVEKNARVCTHVSDDYKTRLEDNGRVRR